MDDFTQQDFKLIERNAIKVYNERQKDFKRAGLDPDDAIGYGAIGYMDALATYREGEAPLEFWLIYNVRWAVKRALRDALLKNRATPTNEPMQDDVCSTEEQYIVTEEHERVREYLIKHQDDEGCSLLLLRYFGSHDDKPMSYAELNAITGKPNATMAYQMQVAGERLANYLQNS